MATGGGGWPDHIHEPATRERATINYFLARASSETGRGRAKRKGVDFPEGAKRGFAAMWKIEEARAGGDRNRLWQLLLSLGTAGAESVVKSFPLFGSRLAISRTQSIGVLRASSVPYPISLYPALIRQTRRCTKLWGKYIRIQSVESLLRKQARRVKGKNGRRAEVREVRRTVTLRLDEFLPGKCALARG
ncbi:hypothetical protein VTN00DRAFT_3829 [Thermoascus crustaceus]|uniref:uncharacterized protein n=1 Tax=Thermoascus crustaceus TaxID=5088 RepID=UPI00374249F4